MKKQNSIWIFSVIAVIGLAGALQGQQLEPVLGDQDAATISVEIKKIHNLTEVARKPADYLKIIDRCEKILAGTVLEKDQAYLNSLIGWSRNRLAQSHAKTAASMKEMGLVEQSAEELQKAIEQFDLVIDKNPKIWRAWMGRAKIHAANGEYELALEKFVEVTKRKHDQFSAWFNCAELSAYLGQHENAIKYYGRMIKEDASDVQSRTGRASCLLALGKNEEAIDEYRTVTKLQANDEFALCNLGDALRQNENWNDALAIYESAAKLPGATCGLERLANLLCTCPETSLVDTDRAVKAAKQAIDNGEASVEFLNTLAAAYRANGQTDLADEIENRAKLMNSKTREAKSSTSTNK